MMQVPRVESKLITFSFMIQFGSQVTEIRERLKIVNSACEEIKNSVMLKQVLRTILDLGNKLNEGSGLGSAIAFSIESLLNLNKRAQHNEVSHMRYLCKVLAEKLPKVVDFHQDLINLEASSKIQWKPLEEEMQAIIKGLKNVKKELEASINDGPVSDVFNKKLKGFIDVAEPEVASLTNLLSVTGGNANTLVKYFNEDPARYPFEQVTVTLLRFVKLFRNAYEENLRLAELEKKKAEKEANMKKGATSTTF